MKLSLQRIESSVEEASLLQAEELLEQEQLSPLYQIEKNLWITDIQDNEVEVQLSGKTVVGGSCECQRFAETGECEHFVAALLKLRSQLQPRRPSKKKTPKSKAQKLTTAVVLEQASREELVEFVREYARTHRNFAIALKARFASSVSRIDQEDKYNQLLDSTISAVRKPDRSITIRGAQKLLRVLKELDYQLTEAIAEKDLLEASFMARSIIEKVSPLLNKIRGKQKEIRGLILSAFGHLSKLLKQDPAPGLVKDLNDFISAEYDRLAYRSHQLDLQFIKLQQQMVVDDKQHQRLMSAIATLREKYQQEDRPLTPLLLAELTALESAGKEVEAKKLMEQNINEPDVLHYAIEQARNKKQRPRIKALAETGLKLDFPARETARLESLLLRMAEEDQDAPNIERYALARFLDTLDFSYYQKAQVNAGDHWKEQVEQILEQLKQRPYSLRTQTAIAHIYAEEGQLEFLIDLLENTGSIKLVLEFGGYLFKAYPERLPRLYRSLLDQYTEQHLGRTAALRVREVIEHLFQIGADELARAIIEELKGSYPERHSLMEELSIFESA